MEFRAQMLTETTPQVAATPMPGGNWLMGNLRQFNANPLATLSEAGALGRVTRLRFLNSIAYLLAHPDDIKHVLVENHRNYHKGYGLQALKPVLGEGLLTSEDDLHRRQRRLIQPAFHRQRIEAYANVMTGYAAAQVDGWRDGQRLNLHDEMMALTMNIVAKCLFDADVSGESSRLGHAITELVEHYNYNRIGPIGQFIDRFDARRNRQRTENLAVIDDLIHHLIRERRDDTSDRGDLLSMILAVSDAEAGDGTGMSDSQARDELVTLFIAGHETTAIALTWTFYLIDSHPEVAARMAGELDKVLGDPGARPARLPTLEDLERLPYTRRVFAESMRLYPPAYATARIALADDYISGVHVRKGESVVVSQWVTHRDPQWWPDPLRFDPDRFSEEAEAARPKLAYFPFGLGPRRCVGEPFAWMEGHLLLATIAHRYRLRVEPGYTPTPQPKVTLRPAGGLPVRAEARALREKIAR